MQTSPGAMCVISPGVAEQLSRLLPAQTDAMVMNQLGISWTTWMKIRSGRGIRVSTARRMLERVARTHDFLSDVGAGFELQAANHNPLQRERKAG